LILECFNNNERVVMKNISRARAFGISQAGVVMEAAHLTYNAARGIAIVESCIKELQNRIHEIQPREAEPGYKKARYGSKGVKS